MKKRTPRWIFLVEGMLGLLNTGLIIFVVSLGLEKQWLFLVIPFMVFSFLGFGAWWDYEKLNS